MSSFYLFVRISYKFVQNCVYNGKWGNVFYYFCHGILLFWMWPPVYCLTCVTVKKIKRRKKNEEEKTGSLPFWSGQVRQCMGGHILCASYQVLGTSKVMVLCVSGFNTYGFFAMVLAGMNIAAIINTNNNNNNQNQNNQNNNIQGVQEANSASDLSGMNTASVRRRRKRATNSGPISMATNTREILPITTTECSMLSLLCKLNTLAADQGLPSHTEEEICLYLTVAFIQNLDHDFSDFSSLTAMFRAARTGRFYRQLSTCDRIYRCS